VLRPSVSDVRIDGLQREIDNATRELREAADAIHRTRELLLADYMTREQTEDYAAKALAELAASLKARLRVAVWAAGAAITIALAAVGGLVTIATRSLP
jgi:glutathione S-transferase